MLHCCAHGIAVHLVGVAQFTSAIQAMYGSLASLPAFHPSVAWALLPSGQPPCLLLPSLQRNQTAATQTHANRPLGRYRSVPCGIAEGGAPNQAATASAAAYFAATRCLLLSLAGPDACEDVCVALVAARDSCLRCHGRAHIVPTCKLRDTHPVFPCLTPSSHLCGTTFPPHTAPPPSSPPRPVLASPSCRPPSLIAIEANPSLLHSPACSPGAPRRTLCEVATPPPPPSPPPPPTKHRLAITTLWLAELGWAALGLVTTLPGWGKALAFTPRCSRRCSHALVSHDATKHGPRRVPDGLRIHAHSPWLNQVCNSFALAPALPRSPACSCHCLASPITEVTREGCIQVQGQSWRAACHGCGG